MTIFEALALTVMISIIMGLAFGVWFLVQFIKARRKAEQEFLNRHGFGSHLKQKRIWEYEWIHTPNKKKNTVPESILEATEKRRGNKC
ncbi:TPA: hypothetical protein ACNIDW_001655 [Acinetobacter nosocomialis]